MEHRGVSQPVRIQLTEAQKAAIQRVLGRDAEELELRIEELEERIAPRLASNHNLRCLRDV